MSSASSPRHRVQPVKAAPSDFLVVDCEALPESELEGLRYGGAGVCLIFVDVEPGEGPRLHRHPYEEVFIVLEGRPRFVVASETLEATAGRIVVVRTRGGHTCTDAGRGRLRRTEI